MGKNLKISLSIFLMVSSLTCITCKDVFVIAMFLGMVVFTLISILVGIKKGYNVAYAGHKRSVIPPVPHLDLDKLNK